MTESEGFASEPELTLYPELPTPAAPTRWRKKPVVIDAWQWNPGDLLAAGTLVGVLLAAGADFHHPDGMGDATTLAIRTLEGEMLAQPGDWIIRGVKGEFYPCRADIFAETYKPAGEES